MSPASWRLGAGLGSSCLQSFPLPPQTMLLPCGRGECLAGFGLQLGTDALSLATRGADLAPAAATPWCTRGDP